MSSASRTAIVVGASITGLGAALNLSRLGFAVTVLEASHCQQLRREIINCPPNMSRILNSWGIDLVPISVKLDGMMFRDSAHDELVGFLDIPPEMIHDLGADYYYAHYADYYHVLMDKATKAGAHVRFGCKVYNINLSSGVVSYRDRETRTATADLVIVAAARHHIPLIGAPVSNGSFSDDQDADQPEEINEKWLSLVGHLTAADKRKLEVSDLDNMSRATFWMAPHGTICYIPMSSGEVEIFARYRTDIYQDAKRLEDIPPSFLATLPPRVQEIIKYANLGTPRMEPTNTTCHRIKSGKVVFIGEAAHPWFPNGTHRHAMGIEDVGTIGRLLSLKIPIEAAITAYHAIRLERWNTALVSDRGKLDYPSLPPGKAQEERNTIMRQLFTTLANADDSTLCAVFEEYLWFFNYDAVEAVDEWWNIARHSPLYQ